MSEDLTERHVVSCLSFGLGFAAFVFTVGAGAFVASVWGFGASVSGAMMGAGAGILVGFAVMVEAHHQMMKRLEEPDLCERCRRVRRKGCCG